MIRNALCLASSFCLLTAAACSSDNSPASGGSGSANGGSGSASGGSASGSASGTTDSGTTADATVDTGASSGAPADTGTASSSDSASSQTPPMGYTAIEAWLQMGFYKSWTSEPAIHMQRPPSPHGFDRIYSNAIIAANATGTAPWPVGAAAVKELYNSLTDTTPVGYAVYLKTQSDSAGGANWYWYERIPTSNTMIPHDGNGVVADGLGGADASAPPNTICVGCHAAAGSDMNHTPSPNGRDQVYTPLPQQ